jgi:AcrR family transcriptional regulator
MTEIVQKPVRGERAIARRRHLLDTARALFVAQGFHQTGIARIADVSGIAVGQIYRDFETKGEIIAAICEADVTEWLDEDALAAAVASGDPQAIRGWLTRFSDDSDEDDDGMLIEILAEAARNPEVATICSALDVRIRESLSTALRAIAPPGAASDDEIAFKIELILTIGFGARCRRIFRPELRPGMFAQAIGYIFDGDVSSINSVKG